MLSGPQKGQAPAEESHPGLGSPARPRKGVAGVPGVSPGPTAWEGGFSETRDRGRKDLGIWDHGAREVLRGHAAAAPAVPSPQEPGPVSSQRSPAARAPHNLT